MGVAVGGIGVGVGGGGGGAHAPAINRNATVTTSSFDHCPFMVTPLCKHEWTVQVPYRREGTISG